MLDSFEDLVEGRRPRRVDEQGEQILLLRLTGLRGTLPQHVVDVVWDVLDLHASHRSTVYRYYRGNTCDLALLLRYIVMNHVCVA